ncbi:DNA primase [Calycomorphotria hydatis]|uniref:DNA primase n=1 Tax=Calycomorphotria hydatis TaxID=2528027 RepID=A0A517T3J3_9PLAN|nr:DNA primase [Calycomorphotria hydatis]
MAGQDEFKELVRSRTNIVEVIAESITLTPRRGGAEFVGLCPFHDDHSPSMNVYPDRQSYRCWVCDAGGDVFSYVMQHDGLSFPQALEQLAERAGLEMPKRRQQTQHGPGGPDKNRVYEVLAWAEREFHNFFLQARDAEIAREYIASRGFTDETIARFKVGYHPREWEWLIDRARGRFTTEDLNAARLLRDRSDSQGYRDDFVDRVLFPIHDERGRAVAFGGRVLPGRDEHGPKYLNSQESPLFTKSRLLYALDLARDGIRATKPRTALVMEGYTDCIAAHQAGYTNAVAPLGTSLTESHVTVLKRFAEKVVLVFDGDGAGMAAAERALEKFLAQDVDLRILTLPEGLDPADFLAKDTNNEFVKLTNNAPDALDFKLKSALAKHDMNTTEGRGRVADDVLATLAIGQSQNAPRMDAVLGKLADRLMISEQKLRGRLRDLRGGKSTNSVANVAHSQHLHQPKSRVARTRDELAERELLAGIMNHPETFESIATQIGPDDFRSPELADLFEYCRDISANHGPPAYDLLLNFAEPECVKLIVSIDSDAREKKLFQNENEQPPTVSGETADNCPAFLHRAVDLIKRRRQEQTYERSKGQIAEKRAVAGDELDEQMKDLLRQAHLTMAGRHSR